MENSESKPVKRAPTWRRGQWQQREIGYVQGVDQMSQRIVLRIMGARFLTVSKGRYKLE